jgi:phospholipid/cholesterol/gamma-HCH transport system permease protein
MKASDRDRLGLNGFFGRTGEAAGLLFANTARLFGLFGSVVKILFSSFSNPKAFSPAAVSRQMLLSGVESLGIISLVAAAVGTVLALQAAYQLKLFGAVIYTGSLVSVSVTRELGPLVAAIVISGRIGARMAAEIGTMKVQEEVSALITMGIHPVRFLVVPRCLAMVVMLPCLTVITDVVAMAGGYLIGVYGVGINADLYVAKSIDAMVLKDIYTGLGKSFLFALIIALVSCHQGLSVEGGAEGVGRATTQAVVISIVLIIVVDCLATAIIYYALPS